MATFVGTEVSFEAMLSNLVQLDFDAAAAYQAAIDRLETPRFKATMRKFRADHLRHTKDLGAVLHNMGHDVPREGDAMQVLTTGKVVLAGLVGDSAILTAMRTNEDDTVTAYDRAVAHPDCPENARDVLKRGQKDEHRHREWIVAALKSGEPKRTRRPAQGQARRPARQTPPTRQKASARKPARQKPKVARPKRATKRRASR